MQSTRMMKIIMGKIFNMVKILHCAVKMTQQKPYQKASQIGGEIKWPEVWPRGQSLNAPGATGNSQRRAVLSSFTEKWIISGPCSGAMCVNSRQTLPRI